jgi:hypothetical protein
MGNRPCALVDAPAPPPLVVPPLLVAPLPVAVLLPLAKLMPRIIGAPLGAIIPVAIKT